jgi:FAD/FMN-containing dehydrogenase
VSRVLTRRQFLKAGAGAVAGAALSGCIPWRPVRPAGVLVNDVHGKINPTRVRRIVSPHGPEELVGCLKEARDDGRAVCVSGARHAMGGQQFGTDGLLVDMTTMNRVLAFDAERGEVEVEAGASWPQLMEALDRLHPEGPLRWGIRQKQTGADSLTLGGALASNVHGRGLAMPPIISDVAAFTLVDPRGRVLRCSRQEHADLFSLVIGGYGLFGIVTAVRLRLSPRVPMARVVDLLEVELLPEAFERRIAEGCRYGDFQYAIDPASGDFLRQGILSCYRPLPEGTEVPARRKSLASADWEELLYLAHTDPARAFRHYADFYRSTSGQVYWSDEHQLSTYVPDYHLGLDRRLGAAPATELITELYVPRAELPAFLDEVREDFRTHRVPLIYGTIRLVERDAESFLAWARQPYACVIFNVHTVHTPEGIQATADTFRRLIDLAIKRAGSYYLTYHRFARRDQVEACYPRFPDFLELKRRHDPDEHFQSDWYRHYKGMFHA